MFPMGTILHHLVPNAYIFCKLIKVCVKQHGNALQIKSFDKNINKGGGVICKCNGINCFEVGGFQ